MVSNEKKNGAVMKPAKKKQSMSDIVFSRIMVALAAAFVGVFGMLVVKKSIANEARFITWWLPVLMVVGVLGLAAAIWFFVRRNKEGFDDSGKIFTKWNVLGAAVAFAICLAAYRLTFDAIVAIYLMVIMFVLYFAWHSFDKTFFAYLVVNGAVFLLYKVGSIAHTSVLGRAFGMAAYILAAVIAVLGIILAVRIISGKGTVSFGKKKVDFGGRGAVQVWPLFVGGVIAVVGGILGIVASQLVVYASGALLMVWAAAAVAYVLKMM